MNVIEISSGDDLSDASVYQKMLNVAPLAVAHPLSNLIILNDSFEASYASIKDGSEPLSPYFGINTDASVEKYEG